MTDTQDLIARLREGQKYDCESGYPIVMDYIMDEAADALQAAQAEIERLSGLAGGHANENLRLMAEIEAVRKANVDCVNHFDALRIDYDAALTALAECRDAFLVPDAGTEIDGWYLSAIADPLAVPAYVKACLAVQPSQADAQDAARYRWLREQDDNPDADVMIASPDGYGRYLPWVNVGEHDAAIDSAINAKGAV